MKRKINLNFNFNLSKSQQELYDLIHHRKTKYVLANFSRQQGKTTVMKVMLIEYLCKYKYQVGFVTTTLKNARNIYKEIIEVLKDTGLLLSYNGSDLFIKSINHSSISFLSAEQGDTIRGNTFTHLIVDEAAFFPEGDETNNIWYSILQPTIKAIGRKVIMISTPNGKNGFWYELIQKALRGDKGYKYIKKTIYDDAFVTEEEIEEYKKTLPHNAFQQEYMSEFLDSASSAIPNFEKQFKEYDYNNNLKQWVGIDLSSTGEDDTVITFINELNQTKQKLLKGSFDMKYQLIANEINNCNNLIGVYVEINGIGEPMYNEIIKKVNKQNKNKIHKWLTTNSSKNEIIDLLNVQVQNDEIVFQKDNKILFNELSTFIFKISKSKKIIYEAKQGFHDDYVMSLAIALKAKKDLTHLPSKEKFIVPKGRRI